MSIGQEIQTAALKVGLSEDFFNIFEKIVVLDSDIENTLIFYFNITEPKDITVMERIQAQLKEAFPERKILIFDKDITMDSQKSIKIEECSMRIFTKPCMVCDSTKSYFMTNFLGIRVCEKCIEKAHNEMQNAERKC